MQKRVLVTGVSGFAGRYLSPVMAAAGYEVVGTAHVQDGVPVDGCTEVHKVDLRDPAETQALVQAVAPTHVVHLAAISFVGHEDVREIYETNIVGSRNLLSALAGLAAKPQRVLLTSSANVYGNSTKGILTEADELNPANDYAVSKAGMEMMSRQFAESLDIVIARPFNYTGIGQADNFLIPKIVGHFRDRAAVVELGNTDVSRDFSDVRTVVDYFRRLLESPLTVGHVYNVCSGVPSSLQQIVTMCEAITGRTIEVRINPAFVRANEIKTLVGSPARLHADIGSAGDIPLEETLRWMLEA